MTDADPTSGPDARPAPESLTYEAAVSELEDIIRRIEQGAIGLEETLVEWRRGGALLARCTAVLDVAEQELIRADAETDADGASGGSA